MHTMGRLFIALFSLLLAILLGGLGAALSLWVAAGAYRSEWALRPALWAVEHTPLPLYASASRVASDLVQRDGLIAAGVLAAVLCVMALSSLRSARLALRSDDHSHDGQATIELKPGPLRASGIPSKAASGSSAARSAVSATAWSFPAAAGGDSTTPPTARSWWSRPSPPRWDGTSRSGSRFP